MNVFVDISQIIIKTPRLILRPWKETDLQDFYQYASVDGVGQMAGWNPHKNLAMTKEILNMFMKKKDTFALEHKGKVIGSLGIEKYPQTNYPELEHLSGCEIGYALSKEYWGQGLMTEAVQAVIRYLFDCVNLDFIIAGCFDWNYRSARVIEKCGFQYIRTHRHTNEDGTTAATRQSILYRTADRHTC